jgi:hypothetical protein
MRVVFTGAFRKPRELTYLIGLALLMTTLLEGYLGYSMVDDLLSGMGSRSATRSRSRSRSSARTWRRCSGTGRTLARTPSSRGCTSRTSSSCPR